MNSTALKIGSVPAVLYGDEGSQAYLFIHGKCGYKEEAVDFAEIVCPKGWQVLSIDLPGHGERSSEAAAFVPWHVVPELNTVMGYARRHWAQIALRATSIGAWFSLLAFAGGALERALFVSPVLDMEHLIRNMMLWAHVDEDRLRTEREIATDFGETLSWEYLQYAKAPPIVKWDAPTAILYAGRDNLTSRDTAENFARGFGCSLTVVEDGEHWFHTPEQLEELDRWTQRNT